MDKDGIEEVRGEAEAVSLEPSNKRSGRGEGVGRRCEVLEEGVPQEGGDRAISLGESELHGVEADRRGVLMGRASRYEKRGRRGREKFKKRREVVAAGIEGGQN